MPTQPCADEPQGSQIIAQTLFLGASVSSFNTSMGWGGQPSQLTVTLIEDSAISGCMIGTGNNRTIAAQFPLSDMSRSDPAILQTAPNLNTDRFTPDHYHTCSGDACYITPKGESFNRSTMDVSQRMVPGKVYYKFYPGGGSLSAGSSVSLPKSFKSRYWYSPDPGFFGQPNRIGLPSNASSSSITYEYNSSWIADNSNLNKGYDIIDTPVMFKMGDFAFGGLVQSWTQQIGQGGKVYTVTINSMQSLLNSCYIILDNYAGAIYSKKTGSSPQSATTYTNNSLFGGPRNYTGHLGVDYFGRLYEGNIPNVFNVYGFLESFGIDGFGGSLSTTEGISANAVVDALSVLTSSTHVGATKLNSYDSAPSFNSHGARTAFSPFGRILAKCMQENDTYTPIGSDFNTFGVIPPYPIDVEVAGSRSNRCQFLLDLSEIPRLPNDVRISGPVISITDLLNQLAEKAGFDYYVDLVPVSANSESGATIHNVIKVKTISRLAQPRPNLIENTIKSFQCNGYALSSTTIGKEKNDTSARSMIIGGKIQRLYQAKSHKLAYTQSNNIYDPVSAKFIDYLQLGTISHIGSRAPVAARQFHHGKIKAPSALNNHNPALSIIINPTYQGVYKHNDEIKQAIPDIAFDFDDPDPDWNDHNEIANSMPDQGAGNYGKAVIKTYTGAAITDPPPAPSLTNRFFPLFQDVICPFFGYVMENEQPIRTDGSTTDFRKIRPVWLDTWTGQIVIVLNTQEIPETSVNLEGQLLISNIPYFTLTESEIRAALAGFDEFIVYCLSKTYKNDLIEMLRRAYILKDKAHYEIEGLTPTNALKAANSKHNWYWNLINGNTVSGGNIAGPFGLTIGETMDKIDGTYQLPEEVMSDLKIIHSFVADIGNYYGKKYMVVAPYLSAYQNNSFERVILPTQAGDAYVFSGGGEISYTYNPTNDGAWEEYGNIIDDCIAVGGKDWYNLTDDNGKIKPILGYNANDCFDADQYNQCVAANANLASFEKDRANPMWSFQTWDIMLDHKKANCPSGNFIFPGLDYSGLNPSDYTLVTVSGISSMPALWNGIGNTTTIPLPNTRRYSGPASTARDAFGNNLQHMSNSTSVNTQVKKLFVGASVEESFVFLDPVNFREPRMLIEAPSRLNINSSNNSYSKDPNRTILATVAMEDLAIYLRSNPNIGTRNYNFIQRLLSHIYSVVDTNSFLGNLNSSANNSASHAMLHPKAAHPFFAAIPLRSNVFSYGPWINYPYLEYLDDAESVFPSGTTIKQSDAIPPACTDEPIAIDTSIAKKAVDNWILPTDVQVIDEYVPWNYGGMAFLDAVAFNDVRSRTNYQNILETAQVDMPGLPLFNLGGTFSYGNFGVIPTGIKCFPMVYDDTKVNNTSTSMPEPVGIVLYTPFIPPTTTTTRTYQVLQVESTSNSTGGPVITNIQTNANQAGITTTYSFRTYTRKLGFFNKENSDRIKRINLDNLRRNKQFSQMSRDLSNNVFKQIKNLQNTQKEGGGSLGSKDFKSRLFGWSPVKVLIGQSYPYLQPLRTNPSGILASGGLSYFNASLTPDTSITSYEIKYGEDAGDNIKRWISEAAYLTESLTLPSLMGEIRHRSDVGLFEEKEVNAQISKDYGLQGMMSLDGIFSPVSFYPTLKNSTFNFGLYDQELCPFCQGTKLITISFRKYTASSTQNTSPIGTTTIYCDKCTRKENKLNLKLKSNITSVATKSAEVLPPYIVTSGTDLSSLSSFGNASTISSSSASTSSNTQSAAAGVSIPINMVSLQPIVVPYGEFRNPNVQSYIGSEGPDISSPFSNNTPRTFLDRCRHSIEVVGRGAVNPTNLNIARGLKDYHEIAPNQYINADYYDRDLRLSKKFLDRGRGAISTLNNQRFMGLRGPLVLHAWGYDLEGYPVPNAADEPYAIDSYGRPQRFKIKVKEGYPKYNVQYKDVAVGSSFRLSRNGPEFVKERELLDNETLPLGSNSSVSNTSSVTEIIYEDDLTDFGGFPPDSPSPSTSWIDRTAGFQGSIISKTQVWTANSSGSGGKWSEKKKLKEFYLNWAERTDLWPVGPIDLRWDADRKVWATKSDSPSIYKMVYVTLEEDLVKGVDIDETYPARGFLDDLEYSKEPLPAGYRRLVYIRDKGGYTAPRGAKLLCRYDPSYGFYEPISKQSYIVGGILNANNTAAIQMSYVTGRKRGEAVPTMTVPFTNPFDFNIIPGNKGLFTFMNGEWTLTAAKETA